MDCPLSWSGLRPCPLQELPAGCLLHLLMSLCCSVSRVMFARPPHPSAGLLAWESCKCSCQVPLPGHRLMQPSQHHSEGCCTDCRAGEVTAKELEDIMQIVSNPRTFKIPDWFLNRQKDHKDGRFSQLTSSALDTKLREDLERLKKIRWAGSHHF